MEEEEDRVSLRRSPSLERIDRPPSLYRPPIRSLASPPLSTQEVDELTNPNLPYRTGYTYAFSRSYSSDAGEEYEIPNMNPSRFYHEAYYGDDEDATITTASTSWIYEEIVTTWYKFVTAVYCTLATTYTGGRSLLEWIYYILYSIAYLLWSVVSQTGRLIGESIYRVLYSIGYAAWFVLDSVGRSAYYVGAPIFDTLLYPFRAINNYMTVPRVRKVYYSERNNEVHHYDSDEPLDREEEEEEESSSSSSSFIKFISSPFSFFKRHRTHMEPIYELRSRTVEKEVGDWTDTDDEVGIEPDSRSHLRTFAPSDHRPILHRRVRSTRQVSYADVISNYASSFFKGFKDTLIIIALLPLYILQSIVNGVCNVVYFSAEGTQYGAIGVYKILSTIVDYALIRPIQFVDNTIRSSMSSSPSKRMTVSYTNGINGRQRLTKEQMDLLMAPPELDDDEDEYEVNDANQVNVVNVLRQSHRSNEEDGLGDLPIVSHTRRRVVTTTNNGRGSRRISESFSYDGDHINTTPRTRRFPEYSHFSDVQPVRRRIIGRNGMVDEDKSIVRSTIGLVTAAPMGIINGTAKVVDSVVLAPIRYVGYGLQNTVNYAIAPVRGLFTSDDNEDDDEEEVAVKRTIGMSRSSRAVHTSSPLAPVGGVVWAITDSATTVFVKIYDTIVFAFYLIFQAIRAIGQIIAAGFTSIVRTIASVFGLLGSGVSSGTSGTAPLIGGALTQTGNAIGGVISESADVIMATGTSIANGAGYIWGVRPSSTTVWNLLKWLLFLLPLILFFWWIFAAPPLEKETEDQVQGYIKHVNSIMEDYYAYGQHHTRSIIGTLWDKFKYFFWIFIDFFRAIPGVIYSIVSGGMEMILGLLATWNVDKWFEAAPIKDEGPPVPPPVIMPTMPECCNPPPPVIIPAPGPTTEEQEALVAAIVTKVTSQMEQRLSDSLNGRIGIIEENVRKAQEELHGKITVAHEPIDYSSLDKMIAAAIRKYDSDKTGLVDFALESAGGQILSTRCSETYALSTRVEKIFDIPLYYSNYGPRVVIQRNSQALVPGECWAFKGGIGYLTIKLAVPITVNKISYEHIPKVISRNGENKSAPKVFSIYTYQKDEYDFASRTLLGQFTYDAHGEPLQFFNVDVIPPYPVQYIELQVDSNYGEEYTCLYRFRVHGDPIKK